MKVFGLSRTRDSKGVVVKRDLRPYVNCIHTSVGSGYENMQVLVLEMQTIKQIPINTAQGVASCIKASYCNMCWANFVRRLEKKKNDGFRATAIIEVYDE